jgi:hypothetical protein
VSAYRGERVLYLRQNPWRKRITLPIAEIAAIVLVSNCARSVVPLIEKKANATDDIVKLRLPLAS